MVEAEFIIFPPVTTLLDWGRLAALIDCGLGFFDII
jgi:hypothetical protein